jgi:hypothetical protein
MRPDGVEIVQDWETGSDGSPGFAARPLMRGAWVERIWTNETGILQATLFGLLLLRERQAGGDRSELQVFLAAYRYFTILREGIFGSSRSWFSPDEALEVVRVVDASLFSTNICCRCEGVFWLEKGRTRRRCPICGSIRWVGSVDIRPLESDRVLAVTEV